MKNAAARPLWTCAKCRRAFANRNQTHTCAPLDLEHHFSGRDPVLRELFAAFLKAIEEIGPAKVLPEKTRIAFQTRMSFAQLTPRKKFFVGHLVLATPTPHQKFIKIETFSPRNHTHCFRFETIEFLDDEFAGLLAQAYAVGNQEHLKSQRQRQARK